MSAEISKAVQQLLEARRSGVQVKPPFALPVGAEGRAAVYAIQDGVAQASGRTGSTDPSPPF